MGRWLNKQQAQASGLPCFIPKQVEINGELIWEGTWANAPEPVADILLPYTRCIQLGCPVGAKEIPSAYVYKAAEKSSFRYVPFWSRFAEQIDMEKVNELEARVIKRRRGDGVRKFGL